MAAALSSWKTSAALQRWPSSGTERLFSGNLKSSILVLPRHHLTSSIIAFSRRRNNNSAISSSSSKKKKKTLSLENSREAEDDIDEDAFEALFNMLEEDLKNDESSVSDDIDDDIREEDLEKLQRELEEVLGVGDDGDVEMLNSAGDDVEDGNVIKEHDVEEEEDGEERPVKLKNWQLRRLARALKNGRRKTSIKSLAAELCLDRAIVLELLRDPPPNLVVMSAALPDQSAPTC